MPWNALSNAWVVDWELVCMVPRSDSIAYGHMSVIHVPLYQVREARTCFRVVILFSGEPSGTVLLMGLLKLVQLAT